MSVQAFFDFSSSVVNPKYVGLSPFFAPEEERRDTSPPALLSSLYGYTMCTKRALNTRIIGFAEPTLQQCIEELSRDVRAGELVGDEKAKAAVLRQRRGVVDPYALPWAPRPEYMAWLRAQGRLNETAYITGAPPSATTAPVKRRLTPFLHLRLHLVMSEGSRPRPEFNVSFAALSGSSFNPGVTSPYTGTSRMEWSTSTTNVEGRAGRHLSTRSRSQTSVRADSFRRSEGRRMSQDTRRYMQAASASTQTTVQLLLSRLQSYQTFQPFLAHQTPYAPRAEETTWSGGGGSTGLMPRQRPSERTLTAPQLWQVMNGLLDTSVSHLLQHNAEGHFIVTLQSTIGRELTPAPPKVRTVIESRSGAAAASSNIGAASAGTPTSNITASTPAHRQSTASGRPPAGTNAAGLLPERWASEHPEATPAAVLGQREAWSAFEEQRRKENRSFYLRAMQTQLNALQAEESAAAAASCSSDGGGRLPPLRSAADLQGSGRQPHGDDARSGQSGAAAAAAAAAALHSMSSPSEEETRREAERQRALWLSFQDSAAPSAVKVHEQAAPDAPRIVTDYLESSDLHHWLQSSWAHRTHRHESAAIRVQCAYRGYRARCEVRDMRYARRQSFMVGLAAEREARRVWDVALQVQADASKAVTASSDDAMRALQFFLSKINAVVAKRRARKHAQQLQEAEINEYAAVSIQRVYRGHRARVLVNELRHPEIIAERQRAAEEHAAVILQTCWRRHREEQRWRRVRRAACTLQRAVRCRAARLLLWARRRQRAAEEAAALRCFAVRRIETWYARHLAARSAFAAAHLEEMRMVQRVSRGYVDRKRLGEERRKGELRGAAAIVVRRWREVLLRRAAVALRMELAAAKKEANRAAVRDDAAVTIQRAWRCCGGGGTSSRVASMGPDEL